MVSVCSPPPSDTTLCEYREWPPGLPWLRFMKVVSDAPADIIGMITQGLSGRRIASSGDSTLSRTPESICPGLPARASDPVRLSQYLHATMPEAFEGDHLLSSQSFSTRAGGASRELFIWALNHISNNAMDHRDTCQAWRDNTLLDMIECSGLVGSEDPILAEPTVMSVLEKVWATALRQCRYRVVSWISGLDIGLGQPACRLENSSRRVHRPLIVIILNNEYPWCCIGFKGATCHAKKIPVHDITTAIGVLLTHGASPDEHCCRKHSTPLQWAVQHGYHDIVKTFVEHGVNTQGACYLQNMDFNTLFCLVPETELPRNKPGTMEYLQSLASKAFPFAESPFGTLLSPEGLTRAAMEGSLTLLRSLQLAGADFNCTTPRGEFPLGAAIASSRRIPHPAERCRILVDLGASIKYEAVETVNQEVCPSALHIASAFGNRECVKYLISKGANQHTPARFYIGNRYLYGLNHLRFRTPDSAARSPLGWALWGANCDCAILLLNSGAPVEGHELLTLFSCSYSQPPAELVEALIARNVDLQKQSNSGQSALDIAVLQEWPTIASILARAGASSKCTSSAIQALIIRDWVLYEPTEFLFERSFCLVPSSSHTNVENALLDALAKNLEPLFDSHGGLLESSVTCVELAIHRYPQAYSSEALLKVAYLISRSSSSKAPKWFAILNEILRRRRPEFVDSGKESSALGFLVYFAVSTDRQRDTNALELLPWQLLSQEPRLCHMPSHPLKNPLLELFRNGKGDEGSRQLVFRKLLESDFKVTTAVGLCAISSGCSVNELKQLMELGFDPRRRYRWSHTALQSAVHNGNHAMARSLLDKGVSANARPRWDYSDYDTNAKAGYSRRTALQFAAEKGDLALCRLLVDSGANVNAPPANFGGGTALQLAAMKGYIGIVRYLISEGADVHAQRAPFRGMTAIEGAAAQGKLDVVGLLLEHGNFSDGEGRHQSMRAVGYAREEGRHALRLYLERQIGWTEDDEETLTQEDFDEDYEHYFHRDCAGDWESVDEDMDEPDCCRGEESSTGSQSPPESCGEDEELYSVRDGFDIWAAEEEQQGAAPGLAYSAPPEGFWDTCVLPDMDADAGIGETVPIVPGMVVGEIFENGIDLGGQNDPDGGMDQWEQWLNLP